MSSPSPSSQNPTPISKIPIESLFLKASETWDLEKLYGDLEDLKGDRLTPVEAAGLRGLLIGSDRNEIATNLQMNPDDLRNTFTTGIYPFVAAITGAPHITSSRIGTLLENAGYKHKPIDRWSQFRSRIAQEIFPSIAITAFTGIVATLIVKLLTNSPPPSIPVATAPSIVPTSACKTFATCPPPPNGFFRYAGSTSWAPIRGVVDAEIQRVYPKFNLQYVSPEIGSPSSANGLGMLLQGSVDLTQIARPLSDSFRMKAQQQGQSIDALPIALNGFTVIVHPDTKIPGLTLSQLRDIYAGRIGNWKDLGGDDRVIQVFDRERIEDGLPNLILGNEPPSSATIRVTTPTEGLQQVSRTPGGIYYALILNQCNIRRVPLGTEIGKYFDPEVPSETGDRVCGGKQPKMRPNFEALRQTGQYPIKGYLYVVILKNNRIQQQVGESYANLLLSEQGQDLIEKTGYVRIR
jgi:phosphate transport system substrate-binding protein